MPFCSKCGVQFEGAGSLCPSCSRKNAKERFATEFDSDNDHTASFDKKDIESNKGMSVLAYIGILFIIPYFTGKNSGFTQFHAKQGLVLFLFEVFTNIVMTVLRFVFGWIRILSILLTLIHSILGVVILAFIIIGIANVLQGKAKTLPFIGKFAPKF